MDDGYLVPESWALPIAAFSIGVSEEEAQRMIDAGELELTIESVERVALQRRLAFLLALEDREAMHDVDRVDRVDRESGYQRQ